MGFDLPGGLPLTWSKWEPTGGGAVLGGPAVASWAPDRLDCFALGFESQVLHRWRDDGTWHDWEDLGAPPGGVKYGTVTAVSWGVNRVDCFVRGDDEHLWQTWWDGKWNDWHDIDLILGLPKPPAVIQMTSSPCAVSSGPNRIDVFAVHSPPVAIDQVSWDGSKWQGWFGVYPHDQPMTQYFDAAAAVTHGPGHFALYVEGMHHNLWNAWWNGEIEDGRPLWRGWADMGGPVMGPPAVVLRGSNVELVVVGIADNYLRHRTWNGVVWRPWEALGDRPVRSAPTLVSLNNSSVEVFAVLEDHRLWQMTGQSGVTEKPQSPPF